MRTILFLCTGNTCRSPMAEAIAQRWLDEGGMGTEPWLAASAGLAAGGGSPPTREAVSALAKLGLAAEGRSKSVTAEMIAAADAVFGMTRAHVLAARGLVADDPAAQQRVHALDPDGDVDDPFGAPQAVYEAVAARLAALIPSRLTDVLERRQAMKIAIGSDHRGRDAVEVIAAELEKSGHAVKRYGPTDGDSCDYPDAAIPVARAVADGACDRGLLVCGSGIGMSIAANKVGGVRAALVTDADAAEMCRRHNDANVLCASAQRSPVDDILRYVRVFLETPFDGGRHAARLEKIAAIECAGVDQR